VDARDGELVKPCELGENCTRVNVAVQKEKIVARAKKLLGLAASPNEHEAATALARAREFMAQHGLTEDDVSDDVVETVDERPRASHRALAEAAALAYEVSALCGRKGEIAMRGPKSRVDLARECYRSLLRASVECGNDHRVKGSPSNVRDAWLAAAWRGYVDTIMERCEELRRERRQPKPKAKHARRATSPVEQVEQVVYEAAETEPEPTPTIEIDRELTGEWEAEQAARSLAEARRNCDTNWLYREAYSLGKAVGLRADLSGRVNSNGGALTDGSPGEG